MTSLIHLSGRVQKHEVVKYAEREVPCKKEKSSNVFSSFAHVLKPHQTTLNEKCYKF